MQFTGEQLLPQPQQLVWESLNDPEILKACIPGCEIMEKTSEDEYKVGMVAAVGPLKARFSGKLVLSDIVHPVSYKLTFEGTGGVVGFGKGNAQVVLTTLDTGTMLRYESTAQVGGKLAQIGSRLVDGAARKIADAFFAKFSVALQDLSAQKRGTTEVAAARAEIDLAANGNSLGTSGPGTPAADFPAVQNGSRTEGGTDGPTCNIGMGFISEGQESGDHANTTFNTASPGSPVVANGTDGTNGTSGTSATVCAPKDI